MSTSSEPIQNSTVTSPIPLTPVRTALDETQFHKWFPRFKRISPKATIINLNELQPNFLEWFEEESVRIPKGAEGVNGTAPIQELNQDPQPSHSESDDDDDRPYYDFGPLNTRIRSVLDKYDGRVFPKLNWSAPQDSGWMLPGNDLQCMSPADVYLLLKSSDFITNDIQQARELTTAFEPAETVLNGTANGLTPTEPVVEHHTDDTTNGYTRNGTAHNPVHRPELYLTLKKWFDMPPSHEFRLFVRANKLVAICQRDTVFYEHLQPPERQEEFINLLTQFWQTHLKRWPAPTMPDQAPQVTGAPIPDYLADVYVTRNLSSVFLVDINPYLPRTDALLFDWDELEKLRFPEHFQDQMVGPTGNSDQDDSIPLPVSGDGADVEAEEGRDSRPVLRLIRSFAEQQAAGGAAPKYSANMIPQEALNPAAFTGEALIELARDIQKQQAEANGESHVNSNADE